MKIRIQTNDPSGQILKRVAALLSSARLRPADVEHRPDEQLVTFPLRRHPFLRGGFFGTRRAKEAVPSRVTIRNVTESFPVDGGQCEEIRVLFGLSVRDGEVYLCSVEEDQGVTCFELRCRVGGFDIELEDA